MKLLGVAIEDVLGSKIKTIDVSVDCPFDSGAPVLTLFKIILEDGREIFIEGEHDVAYIPISGKGINQEVLLKLAEAGECLDEVKSELDIE